MRSMQTQTDIEPEVTPLSVDRLQKRCHGDTCKHFHQHESKHTVVDITDSSAVIVAQVYHVCILLSAFVIIQFLINMRACSQSLNMYYVCT